MQFPFPARISVSPARTTRTTTQTAGGITINAHATVSLGTLICGVVSAIIHLWTPSGRKEYRNKSGTLANGVVKLIRYATHLDGRDPEKPEIRPDEAIQMFELGFNFSLYGERGEYRLSIPYQIARETGSDRITFLQ